jgi:hypothetical protein
VKFRATVLQSGKTATGIEVPESVVEALGSGKRPAVRVTLNGYMYRNTIAVMSGVFMLSVSSDVRQQSGVRAGDEVDVEVELDTAPREVSVPADVVAALEQAPDAKGVFDGLSYSNKLRIVLAIDGAKTAETRQRRIASSIANLREGRA